MSSDSLTGIENEVYKHLFSIRPDYAIFLGLHDYDGLLPQFSAESIEKWTPKAKDLIEQLKHMDIQGLDQRRTLDRELLVMLLERALFDFQDLRIQIEDPIPYASSLNIQTYIARDYAPAEQRIKAVIRHLKAIPDFLQTAQKNLSPTLPKPHIKVSIEILKGTPTNFQEARRLLEAVPTELRSEFEDAAAAAVKAIEAFSKSLVEEYLPHAKEDFALGTEKLAKLLWFNERIETPVQEVLEVGMRDTEKNRKELLELVRKIDSSKTPQEVLSEIALSHSTAESLIKDTSNMLEEIRQYVIDQDLVSIPSEERCKVTETPTFARGVFTAAMDPPGTFETGSQQALYYVTPVDSSWSKERQEEWLRYLNTASLKAISIHEAYPGHYVHFLHVRLLKNLASKTYFSYAFVEGWAHYCEEMLLQEKYGAGDMGLKIAQLKAALVRDCRYVCSFKMHTRQFTLEEATQYFIENAFMERLPAEREALRGTFDPGYYSYTLGKLFIKKARENYFAKHPNANLKEFHDGLLAMGSPPIGLLEKLTA